MKSVKSLNKISIVSPLQPARAWIIIVGFIFITLLLVATGLGGFLNFVFPALALFISVFLYFRYPILYMGFTWWLWFLTPLVRRLADYRGSFTDPSPILLAPLLASLVAGLTFARILPKSTQNNCWPYVLICSGIIYGYFIGLIKASPSSVSIAFLEWISPIFLSCHLFANWRDYPSYRKNIKSCFLWCALVVGAYGVFQYLVAPAWDTNWLINVSGNEVTSFGKPEPLELRVWSTMHGPGVFGVVMMAALLLLLDSIEPLSLPANILGYLSFLLCSVRSAWVGWAVGLMSIATSLKPKFQIRLITIIIIGSLCIVPLTLMEPFSSVITPRLETFLDLKNDGSGIERQENYERFLAYALKNIIGDGLGNNPGLLDSQFLELLINLGWIGVLAYTSGLLFLMLQLTRASGLSKDTFFGSSRAITLAMFSQIVFGSVMTGLPGVMFWAFLGISLSAMRYHRFSLSSKPYSNISLPQQGITDALKSLS
jgi:hypothetical protein